MNRTNRNDPCPCGSGLKFKKCCLPRPANPLTTDDEIERTRALAFKDMSLEKWNEAIEGFKRCLDSVSDRTQILEAIAACYDGLEDYLLAAEYYEKALAVCPPSRRFALTYRLGIARGCAERIDKAAEAFTQCLGIPDTEQLKQQISLVLQGLRDIQDGKIDPSAFRVQVQLQRALSDMEAERYQSAADRLEAISRVDSENPAIFYNLGIVYTFLQREKDAVAQFQRCVDINPLYVQAWYNMGQISLVKNRDYAMARHCFERATAVRPDYIGAHHQRGVACEMLGDKEKAIECWKKTLELDPDNALAKGNIARLQAAAAASSSAT
jgi:tetratricopeptide (TPR) repeat protein